MEGALRGFADALLRAAGTDCSTPTQTPAEPCRDVLCSVAALHRALARGDFTDVAAQLAPDIEIEYFGVHLPGFARLAHGLEAAVELLRANEARMRWSDLALESATALGDTLVLFRRERGCWAGRKHEAFIVAHFQLCEGRISRIRARAFQGVSGPA